MKIREIILWILVIIILAITIRNFTIINHINNTIEIMIDTINHISEFLDIEEWFFI